MSQEKSAARQAFSLDHFIALNDEIAALVRAGMPLERGLMEVGDDVPGRLGDILKRLGQRLSHGESLGQALAMEGASMPRMYRAIVEAGIRAGRLAAALESVARFARHYVEMRRAIGAALLYPALLVLLAYGLFIAFVLYVVPRFERFCDFMHLNDGGVLGWLGAAGSTILVWAPIVPLLILMLAVAWFRSGGAIRLDMGLGCGLIGLLPGVESMLRASRAASFSEVLAVQVEQSVPLAEAVELAAEVTCDEGAIAEARELAAALRGGERLPRRLAASQLCPPLLSWLMQVGLERGLLVASLKYSAETYRRQALDRAELLRTLLPVGLLLVTGATTAGCFIIAVFLPFTDLLFELSSE